MIIPPADNKVNNTAAECYANVILSSPFLRKDKCNGYVRYHVTSGLQAPEGIEANVTVHDHHKGVFWVYVKFDDMYTEHTLKDDYFRTSVNYKCTVEKDSVALIKFALDRRCRELEVKDPL